MLLKSALFYIALPILQAVAAWQVPAEYAITPSSNGRFLQDSDAKPFFWQADTAWLLFHRLNFSEAETYLSDRAGKGFTMVLAVGFTQAGIDSPNRNGDLPFINDDVTKPNEAYWAYVDSIVELAWSKDIRICMVPAWGKYVHGSDNSGSTLVGDTNPYWQNKTAVKADYTNGGAPTTYEVTDWSPVYDDLANGIVAGEREAIAATSAQNATTWSPLMSIHPTNQWFTGGPLALAHAFFGNRTWLTLDASQSGHADYPLNPPIPWWNCRRGWEPVELMYNNGNSSEAFWNASDVRIGSWQAVFSGAAGLTYGANAIQQCIIPGLFDSDGSGPSENWLEDLVLPGSSQMQWIKKVIMDRGNTTYFSRVPAQDIIVGNVGTDDTRVTATRDSGGDWIMVYTPTGE
ncbi:hypothetical protein COH21_012603, partial [Aspergillus flavus]